MIAVFSILAAVAVGVILGVIGEMCEQRRLRGMANEVRRREL